jgi:hypothetical protein
MHQRFIRMPLKDAISAGQVAQSRNIMMMMMMMMMMKYSVRVIIWKELS